MKNMIDGMKILNSEVVTEVVDWYAPAIIVCALLALIFLLFADGFNIVWLALVGFVFLGVLFTIGVTHPSEETDRNRYEVIIEEITF